MSIKIPSHLYRNRHGMFYFRILIPKDLQWYVMQREIRFSLQTEQRQQALASALILIVKLPQHLLELRRMANNSDTPISDGHYLQWLSQLKENLKLKARIEELENNLADAEHKLSKSVLREKA